MKFLVRSLAATALCALGACVPMAPDVEKASKTGGDFAALNCAELAAAEGSLRQRLASLDPNSGVLFGVQSPDGSPVAERRMILHSAVNDFVERRRNRNCIESAPIVTSADALSQPEEESEIVFGSGLYLQVATFAVAENRDAAIAAYRADGLAAASAPVTLVGRNLHRVIVGPLHSRDEIARVDAVSGRLGLRDAFFVRS